MLLAEKNAVVYGAGSVVGGAVARVFAREGAKVFAADRDAAGLDTLAAQLTADGGDAAQIDTLHKRSVDEHADAVRRKAGSIDVSINAVGYDHIYGIGPGSTAPGETGAALADYTRSQVLTAAAAARHMVRQSSGVILTLSSIAARVSLSSDVGVACAGVEVLARRLAGELAPHGVRVVCLRPDAIPATVPADAQHGSARSLDELASLAASLAAGRPATAARRAHTRGGPVVPPPLDALLGRQRAAVLTLLDAPATAGTIAQALQTVPGGATHHLRGLESAGLVTRRRRGQYVIVERTRRGTALLALYEGRAPRGTEPAAPGMIAPES